MDELNEKQKDIKEQFKGSAAITIRFPNKLMWEKYRKYILHTAWDFGAWDQPTTARLEMPFENARDVEMISQKIVFLLQLGFDVYGCHYKLERTAQNVECFEEDYRFEELYELELEEKQHDYPRSS